jgi:hypothetical protein
MGPLLELLLDSRHGRVDLVVGSWRGYRCHIRAISLIGTDINKVSLLSIVVALLVGRSSCHILVALGWGWQLMQVGASISKMTNLSILETWRGRFDWRRTSFVIGCCLCWHWKGRTWAWIGASNSKVTSFLHNCSISCPVGSVIGIDRNIRGQSDISVHNGSKLW